jgi:hypothetical protein
MQKALITIGQHGGIVVRGNGGAWTPEAATDSSIPEWYFGTNTVHELLDRGYLEVIEKDQWDRPIKCKVIEKVTGSTRLVGVSDHEIRIQAGGSQIVITDEGATLDGQPICELHPVWYSKVPQNHPLHEKARLMAVTWIESQ